MAASLVRLVVKYVMFANWLLLLCMASVISTVVVRERLDEMVLADDNLATILAMEARAALLVTVIALVVAVMSALLGTFLYVSLAGRLRNQLREEFYSQLSLLSKLYDDMNLIRSQAGSSVVNHVRGIASRLSQTDLNGSKKGRGDVAEARRVFLAEVSQFIQREIKRRGEDSPRPKFLQELRNLELIVENYQKLTMIMVEEQSTGPQGVT